MRDITMPAANAVLNNDALHRLKNQLGIILGFAELLLEDVEPEHPLRADLLEIQKAARAAMTEVARVGDPASNG